jgi:hypothetical protein
VSGPLWHIFSRLSHWPGVQRSPSMDIRILYGICFLAKVQKRVDPAGLHLVASPHRNPTFGQLVGTGSTQAMDSPQRTMRRCTHSTWCISIVRAPELEREGLHRHEHARRMRCRSNPRMPLYQKPGRNGIGFKSTFGRGVLQHFLGTFCMQAKPQGIAIALRSIPGPWPPGRRAGRQRGGHLHWSSRRCSRTWSGV